MEVCITFRKGGGEEGRRKVLEGMGRVDIYTERECGDECREGDNRGSVSCSLI